jgi:RNA polymerase sigma factor (sigma-70 family)
MTHEPDLVRQAMTGDPDAMGRLWLHSRAWVAASAMAHLPAGADLDDLLQDVAMQMVAGLSSLLQPESFLPWLRTIAVNCAHSAGRKAGVRSGGRPLDPTAEEIPDPGPGRAQSHEDARQRLDRVLALVAHLPVELREPLLLKAIEGLSQRQIAQALQIQETTVETRLARARRLLRRGAPVCEPSDSQPSDRGLLR